MNDDITFKNELQAMEFIYRALGDIAYINNVTPSSPIVQELESIAECVEGVENELSRIADALETLGGDKLVNSV